MAILNPSPVSSCALHAVAHTMALSAHPIQLRAGVKMAPNGRKGERRQHRRAEVDLPATISANGNIVDETARTQNISGSGILFQTSGVLSAGMPVEVILMLGGEIFSCRGRVLRSEEAGPGRFSVAARIDRFSALPLLDALEDERRRE